MVGSIDIGLFVETKKIEEEISSTRRDNRIYCCTPSLRCVYSLCGRQLIDPIGGVSMVYGVFE